jgi:lipopolysaccharide transport system ATP-binding protein
VIIGAAANTVNPSIMHFYAKDAVAFDVIDSFDGDSARGDFPAELHGVVRPLLRWTTRYSKHEIEPGKETSVSTAVD